MQKKQRKAGGFAIRQSTATTTGCHRHCALIGGLLTRNRPTYC